MDFNSFKNKWLGQRIDYDHVFQFQCVDLILEGLYEMFGIAGGVTGNAIDYWTRPSQPLLDKFDRIETTEVHQGDIVVLRTLNAGPGDFSGDGHIVWATGGIDGTNFEGLEQNGNGGGDGLGGNAVRTRWIPRARIAGLYRPKAPAAPPAPVIPFTVELITPKDVRINKATHRWGLNYDNFTAINNNPEGNASEGEIKHVVAILHHNIGYNYYLEEANVAGGYNVLDCDDVPAVITPAPEPPAPTPYVPPAAPLPFPTDKTPYELVVELDGYSTANDAKNHINSKVKVPAGTYMKYTEKYGVVNVTKISGSPGAWINPDDNHVPAPPAPEPTKPNGYINPRESSADPVSPGIPVEVKVEPAKTSSPESASIAWLNTWHPFNKPVRYKMLTEIDAIDLNGIDKTPGIHIPASTDDEDTWIPIWGYFIKDNIIYLRPKLGKQATIERFGKDLSNALWYGIPTSDVSTGEPFMASSLYAQNAKEERDYRHEQHHETVEDRLFYIRQRIAHLVNSGMRWIDIIEVKFKKKK